MRFLLYTLCLAILLAFCSAQSDIASGFHADRSGDHVVSHQSSATAYFFDQQHQYISKDIPAEMNIQKMADVITSTVGIGTIDKADVPEFVNNDLFNRARANLLVTVSGVDKDMMSSLKQSAPSIDLSIPFRPASDISLLSSMVTGTTPAKHGIVGRQWKDANGVQNAFENQNSHFLAPNMQELLVKGFHSDAKPFVFSAASDRQFVRATCARDGHHFGPSSNKVCVDINVNEDQSNVQFKSRRHLSVVPQDMSIEQVTSSITYKQTGIIVRTFGEQYKSVLESFDLSDPATLAFLAEVQYYTTLADALANSSELSDLINDNTPDMFALHITSFRRLITVYGSDSVAVKQAVQILNTVIPEIVSSFQKLYKNQILAEVVVISDESVSSSFSDAAQEAGVQLVGSHVYGYVDQSKYAQLAAAASKQNVEIISTAAVKSSNILASVRIDATSNSTSNTTSGPTMEEIARYQIVLWLAIALTVVLVAAVYSIGYMHIKKDTMVYGSYNPNWESRKRR